MSQVERRSLRRVRRGAWAVLAVNVTMALALAWGAVWLTDVRANQRAGCDRGNGLRLVARDLVAASIFSLETDMRKATDDELPRLTGARDRLADLTDDPRLVIVSCPSGVPLDPQPPLNSGLR